MGLLRLLFVIILILLAIWAWRRFVSGPRRTPASRAEANAQPMVRCAHCNVHVPMNTALNHEQQWYCSSNHRDQGPQQP